MTSRALQSLELLQRSYEYDAVATPELAAAPMCWVGTSLGIAGVPLLVGEGELDEIIETPSLAPIPGTKPWVMGVAAYRGGLLPVVSGDVLFRQKPYAGRVRDFCMILRHPGCQLAITLSSVEGDLKFPLQERDMKHPIDADLVNYTLGGFKHRDKFLAIFDVEKFVASSELSSAAANELNTFEDLCNV